MSKPKAVFVCGPWGSGTSLVAAILDKAGAKGVPPYFQIDDPLTHNTNESVLFRNALLEVASEKPIRLRSRDRNAVISQLTAFRDDLLTTPTLTGEGEAYYFKHALTCLVLPELAQIFDAYFIYVIRPSVEIERTRIRRKWHKHYGAASAGTVYTLLSNFHIEGSSPTLFVRYNELLANPAAIVADMIAFCGIKQIELLGDIVNIVRTK